MSKPVFALLSILLLAPAAPAQVAPAPAAPPSAAPSPAPAPTWSRRSPELNFDQIALVDAMDYFRDATAANLVVDWKALQEVGLSRETPVTIRLRGVTIRVALTKTLEAAAPGLLAFYVDTNVIHVTTRLVADSRLVTRVYDVADLLLDIPDFTDVPQFSLQQSSGSRSGGGGGGGGSGGSSGGLFGGGGGTGAGQNAQTRKPTGERAQELIDLIQSTIRPEVWDVNGGKAAIRFTAGRLIVSAPPDVHRAIGG
ncbi:MAG TPA: hypothetical protein VF595_00640 [Tepidisphaeraceae bacterium]|jgi:hypothetical protein